MGERVYVKRHPDRVSTSFSEGEDDVQWIITVTFDNAAVAGLDDGAIEEKARAKLRHYATSNPA